MGNKHKKLTLYDYHNECKNDVVRIILYIQKIINHPESNTIFVVEQFMNNIDVFDNIIKKFSSNLKKMYKHDISMELIIIVFNYITSLKNLFQTIDFKYLQPCKMQYNRVKHLLQYSRKSFEESIDYVQSNLSYCKEMHINLLKIILEKNHSFFTAM